jgi:hypothetical protein
MTPTAVPPRQVLLFAGHRVDAPGRARPRFAPAQLPQAAAAIGTALDALGAGAADLALSQAAAGGDLLFAEACIARDVPLRLYLPEPEPEFIAHSVLGSAGTEDWRARYFSVKARLAHPPQPMPDAAGAPPHANRFEACNLWLLDTALAHGIDKLHFICLWDGAGGDGPGGTAHMVREVERRGGRVTWIDTRALAAPRRAAAP